MTGNRERIAPKLVSSKLCCATALMMLAASQSAQADWYFVPSISLSAVHDDNLFLASESEDETEDTFARVTPGLSFGYESEQSTLGVDYRQDIESYADNTQLNDNAVRKLLEASFAYRPVTALELSLDARRNESVFPSELNPAVGLGTERVPSERTTITPGLVYDFSASTAGLLEYTHIEEDTEGGTDGEVDIVNTELTHALSSRTELMAGYAYSEYEFSDGPEQRVHTPRVGMSHAFNEHTTLSLAAGPRFTEGDDSVDINFSASIDYAYDRGDLLLEYIREVTTLIGETGVAETDRVRATLRHNFSEAFAVTATISDGEFARQIAGTRDTNALRIGLEADYAVNRAVSVFAGINHSTQDGASPVGAPFEISRNVIHIGITLRLPRN